MSTQNRHITQAISDWDQAYDNSGAVADSADFVKALPSKAARYREELSHIELDPETIRYGEGERAQLDLFKPQHASVGLVIFIHGGYWMRLHRNDWSHLARGPLERGWQMAIPSYTLCPDISVANITQQISSAIEVAIKAASISSASDSMPVRLVGHSAGGHLVSRMLCTDVALSQDSINRIHHVVSVSGIHDLRPLLNTKMNETLKLDASMAAAESPALNTPRAESNLTCWVGAQELPELIRQTALLANIWHGLGAITEAVSEPGKNHFTVIEALEQHDSPLLGKLLA